MVNWEEKTAMMELKTGSKTACRWFLVRPALCLASGLPLYWMRGRIPGILASIGLLALLANFSFSDVPIFKVTIKAKQVYVQMRWNTLSLKESPLRQ